MPAQPPDIASLPAVLPPIAKAVARPEGPLSFSSVLAGLGTGLTLFTGAPVASQLALPFCAPFLVGGETVAAADGANCFNLYRLTEWAKRKRIGSPALLNRLRIARAFTCFQLATILDHMGSEMERHHATRLVITGLPDCLYDEELSEPEARSTFARCRASLHRLAAQSTVLAFADLPPHPIGGRIRFFDSLVALARSVYEVSGTEPAMFVPVFVPVKAPGLITAAKGGSSYGKDSAYR